MANSRLVIALIGSLAVAGAALAAPGGGKGKGNGNGGGDPPAAFEPAIAYRYESNKYRDIRIANEAGDQACVALRVADSAGSGNRLNAFDFSDLDAGILVYSVGNTIYREDRGGDPCVPDPSPQEVHVGNPAYQVTISPDNRFAVWAGDDPAADADLLFLHDLATGDVSPLPLRGWKFHDSMYDPDFADSELILFHGRNESGTINSFTPHLYALPSPEDPAPSPTPVLSEVQSANINADAYIGTSQAGGPGMKRVAVFDNDSGQRFQFGFDGTEVGPRLAGTGGDVAYRCDNAVLINRVAVNWRNKDTYISAVDGSSTRQWSSDDLQLFDWLCP